MKRRSVFVSAVLVVGVSAYSPIVICDEIAFRVSVVDERTSAPCPNVSVTAVFTDIPKAMDGRSVNREVSCLTDSSGQCRFEGSSNNARACYAVSSPSGFYATPLVRYVATNRVGCLSSYRCEPYDCVYTTVLQRIERPIPLYVRKVVLRNREDGIGGFNGTNAVLRYDMMAGDWLPPEGDGVQADMVIRTEYRVNGIQSDGISTLHLYDFVNVVEFPGAGNGFREESTTGKNMGLMVRTAPETGYRTRQTLMFGRRRKETKTAGLWPDNYSESRSDRCYSYRIRSKYDKNGNLVEAYYGKIYGDFNFEGSAKSGLCGVEFLYYLNLTPNDRNLEWDMKTNLCQDPGSTGVKRP